MAISNIQVLKSYFKTIYSTLSITLIFPSLIWIVFISIGYIKVGHLPIRGDIEVVSFNGLDRFLVILGVYIYIFGTITWASLTLLNLLLNFKSISWTKFAIGLLGITLAFFISLTAQFDWLLD